MAFGAVSPRRYLHDIRRHGHRTHLQEAQPQVGSPLGICSMVAANSISTFAPSALSAAVSSALIMSFSGNCSSTSSGAKSRDASHRAHLCRE